MTTSFVPRALLVFLTVLCLSAASQSTAVSAQDAGRLPREPVAKADPAEFPSFDRSAFTLHQAGVTARAARRLLADNPDAPDNVRLLAARDRLEDALAQLRRIVAEHPEHMAQAFRGLPYLSFVRDAARGLLTPLREVVAAARARLADLPREEAADAARVLIGLENQLDRGGSQGWAPRIQAFVEEYAGTEAAQLAAVEVIVSGPLNPARLDSLAELARRYPKTVLAARAQYQRGWDLGHNPQALGQDRQHVDPTDRFEEVLAIVRELESGAYPTSEWVERAPELVIGFFVPSQARFSSVQNMERMLAGYREFVRSHFAIDAVSATGNGVGYLITSKMRDLFQRLGRDPVAGINEVLTDLERTAPDPAAVRYLRALFYVGLSTTNDGGQEMPRARATNALVALHAEGIEPYARRSLATLAALRFFERDYAVAADTYRAYLRTYPGSDWAWVAAIRLGESLEHAGEIEQAVDAYRDAVARFRGNVVVQVLAHARGAEALTGLGRVREALEWARRALDTWDDDYGPVYGANGQQRRLPTDEPFALPTGGQVIKSDLRARVATLGASVTDPAGADLERGRWLLERGRLDEAIEVLTASIARPAGRSVTRSTRRLLHRARLESALRLAGIERPDRDTDGADLALRQLEGEPHDFGVTAAAIARASILAGVGRVSEADTVMRGALDAHLGFQRSQLAPAPASGTLEADLLAIRTLVYQPLGSGIFTKAERSWNAFKWPASLPEFLVVNPDVRVKLAGGDTRIVSLVQLLPGLSEVLLLRNEDQAMLTSIVRELGGSRQRPARSIMETPNRPAGQAMEVGAFWNRYFPVRPGHWSGWVFDTYPQITEVEFIDAERTRAAARVTVGYSGCTVVLVKEGGVWRATELVNFWIT